MEEEGGRGLAVTERGRKGKETGKSNRRGKKGNTRLAHEAIKKFFDHFAVAF